MSGVRLPSVALATLFSVLSAFACSEYGSELVEGSSDLDDAGAPGGGRSGGNASTGGSAIGVPASGGAAGSKASPAGAGAGSLDAGGSDAGGAGSFSGAGGSAGSSVAGSGGSPVVGPSDLLDDFEDEDTTIEQTAGRGGVWYLFDDGTAGSLGPDPLVVTPNIDAPPELGNFALLMTASGFTGFGSGCGVDFRAGKKLYDASQFSGLRFWARVGVGKNSKHRLQIFDGSTEAGGGKCNPAPTAPNGEKCEDHFGIVENFTSVWTQYVIRFADLTQVGWGFPAAAIDKSKLYGLQITSKAQLDVELWVDQIELF